MSEIYPASKIMERPLEGQLSGGGRAGGGGDQLGSCDSQAQEFRLDVTGNRKDLELVSIEFMKTDLVGMCVMD